MKLISIVGARPQFVKIAPVCRAIESHNREVSGQSADKPPLEHLIIHTGQHYDNNMSDVFFDELKLPRADFNLNIGSGPHGQQTGRMLEKIEQVLLETQPDAVIIYGDTNSTVAGALAAAKLHIPVAHVEAGLRSFNRHMPEEINRIAADHISDVLLAPTPTAVTNLETENLAAKTRFTGDIMYDAVLFNRELAKQHDSILQRFNVASGDYGLVTVHRAENTDDNSRLDKLLTAFNEIAASGLKLIFSLHPRTAKQLSSTFPQWKPHSNLQLTEPVGYLDVLCLLTRARVALTDSGGLQKEAFFVGCPCVTLRDETEWVETLTGEGNVLTGADTGKIIDAVGHWQKRFPNGPPDFSEQISRFFGNGDAAKRILNAVFAL